MSRRRGPGRGRLCRQRNRHGEWQYVADYSDAQGKRCRPNLGPDRRVAERRLADLIRSRDITLAGLQGEEGQDRLLSEVCDTYVEDLAAFRKPTYVGDVRRHLTKMQESLSARRVRDVTLQAVLEHRRHRILLGASNP